MSEKTLGQKRVKSGFNPDENETVKEIKEKSAELIDLIEKLRTEGATGEKQRIVSLAQTNIETGCMYAVKGVFTE